MQTDNCFEAYVMYLNPRYPIGHLTPELYRKGIFLEGSIILRKSSRESCELNYVVVKIDEVTAVFSDVVMGMFPNGMAVQDMKLSDLL